MLGLLIYKMNGLEQIISEVFLGNKNSFFQAYTDYIKQVDCSYRSEFMFQHLHKWTCLNWLNIDACHIRAYTYLQLQTKQQSWGKLPWKLPWFTIFHMGFNSANLGVYFLFFKRYLVTACKHTNCPHFTNELYSNSDISWLLGI